MRRTARANASGTQGIPLTARTQYKQNRVHRRTVAHPWVMAPQWMLLTRRQERYHLLPNLIWQTPTIVLF